MRRSLRVAIDAYGIVVYFLSEIVPLPSLILLPIKLISTALLSFKMLFFLECMTFVPAFVYCLCMVYDDLDAVTSIAIVTIAYSLAMLMVSATMKLVSKVIGRYFTKRLPPDVTTYLTIRWGKTQKHKGV